jgi:endonuclease YncB( thermonuclease family)
MATMRGAFPPGRPGRVREVWLEEIFTFGRDHAGLGFRGPGVLPVGDVVELLLARRRARPRRGRRRRRSGPRLPAIVLILTAAAAIVAAHPVILDAMARIDQGTSPAAGGARKTAAHSGEFALCSAWRTSRSCVIDGDTVRIDGVRIRLADIDAPETHEPRCASEAERGARATARLVSLMNEGPVEIVTAGGRDEDRYGRKLRIIARDQRSLGGILVDEGLARPWRGRRLGWCG